MRIGILASGTGTILQALLDADLPIVAVIVDRPCAATERAEKAGVPVEIIARDSFGADFDRLAYTHRVVDALERHEVDLVAMAGFGTILDKPIHDRVPGPDREHPPRAAARRSRAGTRSTTRSPRA